MISLKNVVEAVEAVSADKTRSTRDKIRMLIKPRPIGYGLAGAKKQIVVMLVDRSGLAD